MGEQAGSIRVAKLALQRCDELGRGDGGPQRLLARVTQAQQLDLETLAALHYQHLVERQPRKEAHERIAQVPAGRSALLAHRRSRARRRGLHATPGAIFGADFEGTLPASSSKKADTS